MIINKVDRIVIEKLEAGVDLTVVVEIVVDKGMTSDFTTINFSNDSCET